MARNCDIRRARSLWPTPCTRATWEDTLVMTLGMLVGSINVQVRPRVSGHLVSHTYKEGSLTPEGGLHD